ncbi:hypothetical protein KEM09_19590 [Carboxylicivirga mesophila]|uniref:DUF4412 domain-containing protein n=1 Tax=Carboxylicivirga mesophila TaxID=1166478 RepID=A0ABS5KEZ4_9BACT|nr:hypothetical protein [Carboxylicivirga mesophila]MBS2213621.1 hypothetical protein [Carboxylicivirga mesophila]
MKNLLFGLLLFISVSLTAQQNEVDSKLKDYGLSVEVLANSIVASHSQYAFNVSITSDTDSETVVEKAKYDPTMKVGERWLLLSHNGHEPSRKELKDFNKRFNRKEKDINRAIDKSSLNIELDDKNYLVVGFKYIKSGLPARYAFLANCKGKAFINKSTKQLEKAEFVNEKPLKQWPLKTDKLSLLVNYTYNEAEQIYLLEKETFKMDVEAFGQMVPLKDVYEYSDYTSL